ncbi:hypothetical protein BLNAU_11387 [Blattamonas nauphoetae]|uniref:Uncharacterized protein n=1 Tax=Blattamonas nauphoetae TaxID=2049346 RepID=A0ABQ9X0M7_9EUKA|nr:hypothetical protein BLNAU_19735 [Blattamonas nauphoetae]KAK2946280.1 hypothetical protein BLNAU_18801 [Blattamonas nauphoetae]KAK2953585.1 hypothetical protein BLNAU_11449 [Blattamonas nauphoetae]KAK2953666.1 hypothetical protein BLNAU_11387 [Blattamonas nauphoetae]
MIPRDSDTRHICHPNTDNSLRFPEKDTNRTSCVPARDEKQTELGKCCYSHTSHVHRHRREEGDPALRVIAGVPGNEDDRQSHAFGCELVDLGPHVLPVHLSRVGPVCS